MVNMRFTFSMDEKSDPKITIEGKPLNIRSLRVIWRAPDSFQKYSGENSIMVEGYFDKEVYLRYFKIDILQKMCFELDEEDDTDEFDCIKWNRLCGMQMDRRCY